MEAEYNVPEAKIRAEGDALWRAVTTATTI
jgi:hypothetical protein